jgi:hypothetical protein
MNGISLLHAPQWQLDGDNWLLIVGNRTVAKLLPTIGHHKYTWLSAIENDLPDHGWHAADFETLHMAKFDIEQWWAHMCLGAKFTPDAEAQSD